MSVISICDFDIMGFVWSLANGCREALLNCTRLVTGKHVWVGKEQAAVCAEACALRQAAAHQPCQRAASRAGHLQLVLCASLTLSA